MKGKKEENHLFSSVLTWAAVFNLIKTIMKSGSGVSWRKWFVIYGPDSPSAGEPIPISPGGTNRDRVLSEMITDDINTADDKRLIDVGR